MKNQKIKVVSLTDTSEVISQETLTIDEHTADNKYLLLSKNNFNDDYVAPGYFNKKTNFVLGNTNSIIAIDKQLNIIYKNKTDELITSDKFFLYPIPILQLEEKYNLEYTDNTLGNVYDISFNTSLGLQIGQLLANKLKLKDIALPLNFKSLFISNRKGWSLNKKILINTNKDFLFGIINGYYSARDEAGFIIENVNMYTFTTILNLLGASYSIRSMKDSYNKRLIVKFPMCFKGYVNDKFINISEYRVDNLELVKMNKLYKNHNESNNLNKEINLGHILAVPFSSMYITEDTSTRIFDLTAERADATNYAIPGTPILKNSDGDILAVSGVFTKQGIQDAKVFSPENKEYYKSLNDGKINQWIADDAILGLYNSTVQLKNKEQ